MEVTESSEMQLELATTCLTGLDVDAAESKLRTMDATVRIARGCATPEDEMALLAQGAKRESAMGVLAQISEAASCRGVPFAVIKGLSFEKCFYGDAMLRDVGDIDLLVCSNCCADLHALLVGMGYRQRIGPSSANGSRGRCYAAVAASALGEGEARELRDRPVRRRPLKQELSPYVKAGYPTVEVHDGFGHLPEPFLQRVIGDAAASPYHLVGNPLDNLVFLLLSTYENSESFYSNAFDYGVVLRDYVDLRFFFARYRDSVDWGEAVRLLSGLGLAERAGVVLGNLESLYGPDACCGCLSGIARRTSPWGVGIERRLGDEEAARGAAAKLLRARLLRAAEAVPLPARQPASPVRARNSRGVGFSLGLEGEELVAAWDLPGSMLDEGHYYQVMLFPLQGECDNLAYRIGLGLFGGQLRACGHWSRRFMQGAAVKRLSGDELPVTVSDRDGIVRAAVSIEASAVGAPAGRFAVSPAAYERNHGNVFWDVDELAVRLLEDVAVSHLALFGEDAGPVVTFSFSCLTVAVAFEDEDLMRRVRGVIPDSANGWLIASGTASLNLCVRGTAEGEYSVLRDGCLVGAGMTASAACYELMQAVTDTLCARARESLMVAHAAAVRFGDRVVMLMGPSGRGKTTLALAASRFMPMMGDECVFVRPSSGTACCEKLPYLVKEGNGDALRCCGRYSGEALSVEGGPHGPARYYPRRSVASDEDPTREGEIACIVFPEYEIGSEVLIEPLGSSGLVELVLGSLTGPAPPSLLFREFARMVEARGIALVRVRFGDPEEAADELHARLSEGGFYGLQVA